MAMAVGLCGMARAEGTLEAFQKELQGVVAKAMPSVVTVELPGGGVQVIIREEGAFGGPVREVRLGGERLASGVAIGNEGYIVTSAEGFGTDGKARFNEEHQEGEQKVTVRTADGKKLAAKIVTVDLRSGLAVLWVEKGTVPGLEIAEKPVGAGALVLMVGNTYGMERSVGLAMVSGSGRTVAGGEAGEGWSRQFNDMVQLSVPVRPGDAGGLVADMSGRVVGILHSGFRQPMGAQVVVGGLANGMPFGMPRGPENLGLALSGRVVKKVLDDVQRGGGGMVTWGYLGLSFKTEEGKGLMVTGVVGNGPAAKAGVKEGDIITIFSTERAEGKLLLVFHGAEGDGAGFTEAVSFTEPGAKAWLKAEREGQKMLLEVMVGEAPAEQEMGQVQVQQFVVPGPGGWEQGRGQGGTWLGIQMQEEQGGVKVVRVLKDTPADKAGLKEGDLIEALDGVGVKQVGELQGFLQQHKTGDKVDLKVKRGEEELFVEVTLGERPAGMRMQGFVIQGPGGEFEVRPGGPGGMPNPAMQKTIEDLRQEVERLRKEIEELKRK